MMLLLKSHRFVGHRQHSSRIVEVLHQQQWLAFLLLCCCQLLLPTAQGRGFVVWCPLAEPTRLAFQDPVDRKWYFVDEHMNDNDRPNEEQNRVENMMGGNSSEAVAEPTIESEIGDVFDGDNLQGNNRRRKLPQRDETATMTSTTIRHSKAHFPSIRPMGVRKLQDGMVNSTVPMQVRECICGNSFAGQVENVWCPVPVTSFCALPNPRHENGYLGCVDRNDAQRGRSRIMVLSIFSSFTLVISFLFLTSYGRFAIDLIMHQILCRTWNPYVADRMLSRDPGRARELIRRHIRIRRQLLERRYRRMVRDLPEAEAETLRPQRQAQTARQRPTSLALKTRIHAGGSSRTIDPTFGEASSIASSWRGSLSGSVREEWDESSRHEDATCTICFMPLEKGERVGDLPCAHTFHVECLKSWLPRRNVCPLCQTENIASPRYEEKGPTRAQLPDVANE